MEQFLWHIKFLLCINSKFIFTFFSRLSVEGWLAYSKLQIVKSFHNEATAFSIVTVVQVLTAMFLPHWTVARHLGGQTNTAS